MQKILSRRSPFTRAVAVLTSCLVASSSLAAVPTPTTYVDLPVPMLSGWNNVNTFTVDGVTGATPKTFIYPDAATKTASGAADGHWDEDLAVGLVLWELDDGSGRAPGIQLVTDDFDFPTNNCVMASGERESSEFPGTLLPKTCSDPEGSSKRYFLELIKADEPVDLVFNLGLKDIRYKGVKDPATDGGEALAEFRETYGIGRIYRVIQKVINNTDERIAHIRFELGTGVGADFTPVTYADHGVAFEMRTLVPREFFYGETGAPDVAVWDPSRFATFSPKMYDDGSRARFDPGFLDHQPAGFFPPQGIEAGEKSQYIDSGLPTVGDDINGALTGNYFDLAGNQAAGAGLTGNVFGYMMSDSLAPIVIARHDDGNPETESDVIVAWWDGYNWRSGRAGLDGDPDTTADNFAVIGNDQLVQWAEKIIGLPVDCPEGSPVDCSYRYESLVADDLSGLNTDMVIYISDKLMDANGDLTLDSITLRVKAISVDAAGLAGQPGSADPEWLTPGNEAPELASYMPATGTPVAINDSATAVESDPVVDININVLANDLLDGQSLDPADVTAVTLTSAPANGNAVVELDNTITYTPAAGFVGTETFTYTVTIDDGGTPVVSNAAMVKVTIEAAPVPDAPIASNDSAVTTTGIAVTLDVLANDQLNNDTPTTTVISIVDAPLNGGASVTGDTIVYTPTAGFVGYERFTYNVSVDGKLSNTALVTVNVEPRPVAVRSSSSSSGCSAGDARSPLDPMLPGMLLLALAGLWLRRRQAA